MTLFTFQTNYNELIGETKLQSIRYNADYWISRLAKNSKLDIWWRNPRTMAQDCHKLGIAKGEAIPIYGWQITAATARDDGYDSIRELFDVLTELHNITYEELHDHRWAAIRWFWTERYWLNGERLKTSVQTTL